MTGTVLNISNQDMYFNLCVNFNVTVKRKERKTIYLKTVCTETQKEILRGTGMVLTEMVNTW